MASNDEDTPPGRPAPVPVSIAATESPVALTVALVSDERVPSEMVCMGTYRNDRLIARSVMSPEAWQQIQEHGIFGEPLPVVLVAREAPPGLQCQLFAMVTLSGGDEADSEPWAASVPSFEERDAGDDETDAVTPIPLGNIVRYARDRVHPDSLPLEAMDVLRKVVEGNATEVVDRALADLLGL